MTSVECTHPTLSVHLPRGIVAARRMEPSGGVFCVLPGGLDQFKTSRTRKGVTTHPSDRFLARRLRPRDGCPCLHSTYHEVNSAPAFPISARLAAASGNRLIPQYRPQSAHDSFRTRQRTAGRFPAAAAGVGRSRGNASCGSPLLADDLLASSAAVAARYPYWLIPVVTFRTLHEVREIGYARVLQLA